MNGSVLHELKYGIGWKCHSGFENSFRQHLFHSRSLKGYSNKKISRCG